MAWKKVTEENGEFWQPTEVAAIEGKLLEKQENVGQNNSKLYILQTESGPMNVWGTSVLDKLLAKVATGSDIRINYLGERTSPKSGRTFKAFEVWENVPDQK